MSKTEPKLHHLIEARTAAAMTLDDAIRLGVYLKWSGLSKPAEEVTEICNWLARIQDRIQTEISREAGEE